MTVDEKIQNLECHIRRLSDSLSKSLILPPGGSNGQVLAKSSTGLIWVDQEQGGGEVVDLSTIRIIVPEDGATDFFNVIQVDDNILSLTVEGYPQINEADVSSGQPADYRVQSNGIKWINPNQILYAGFVIEIIIY